MLFGVLQLAAEALVGCKMSMMSIPALKILGRENVFSRTDFI